jgi:hypothetical protein
MGARHRLVVPALLALLTAGHFLTLSRFVRPAYAAPDADGYYAQARLIVQEGRLTFEPASPAQHLGMHWLEKPDGSYISRYPAGFPLLLGAVWSVAGRDASLWVNAALAALTLPALYMLAAPYVGAWPALGAVVVQAANPTANFHAVHADAHTAACFFLVLGWALLDGWRRLHCKWLGLAGGFALACVPAVRYAEAAAALGAVAFLALLWRQGRRDLHWPVIGALAPAAALGAVNMAQFGTPWRTAYALTGESNLRWEYFAANWSMYIDSILTSGVGLFAVLGGLGALVMFRERETRPVAAGLGLSALAITLVYMAYYFNPAAGVSADRFLLPTLPLYLPPAIWFLRRAISGRTFVVALAGLVVLQAGIGLPEGFRRMAGQAAMSDRSAKLLAGLEKLVPTGAVLLADRPVQETLHFTGLWKQADLALFGDGEEPMGRRGPRFGPGANDDDEARPAPMQRDKGKALRARYEGLPPREKTALLLADLEAWANPDREIYLVASEDRAGPPFRVLQRAAELTRVGEIEIPREEAPDAGPRGRRRGGPGFGPPGLGPPGLRAGPPSGRITVYRIAPR